MSKKQKLQEEELQNQLKDYQEDVKILRPTDFTPEAYRE